MDGTDQLSNGIPQFREASKDDTGQTRIKNHLEVVQVAGAPDDITCYVVPEDISNDSNVSVEVLQRILKSQETKRNGRLPGILSLQLDNCRGANKNTYLFSYLSWLVERHVFNVIYVSFLPVGHTHFGPDRIASRISTAVRRTNIFTEKRYYDIIRGAALLLVLSSRSVSLFFFCFFFCLTQTPNCSYSLHSGSHNPRPKVVLINEVADFKKLMNPQRNPQFTGALVRRLDGLCTLRKGTVPQFSEFVGKTSNLHFRIAKEPLRDSVCIQNKQTVDVEDWSPVEYVWKGAADSHDFTAWLDQLDTAPSNPLTTERKDELMKYLNSCASRLEHEQLVALKMKVTQMSIERPQMPLHWADGGNFSIEMDRVDERQFQQNEDSDSEQENALPLLDRNCIIHRPLERQQLRSELLSNSVRVDDFIAYKPFFLPGVPNDRRVPIYVGKVTHLNQEDQQVQVRTFHSSDKQPLEVIFGKRTRYKKWNGPGPYQDVKLEDIYYAFRVDSDDIGRHEIFTLTASHKDAIKKVIAAEATNAAVNFQL